jgi:uncharacterized repeat protein (TIGR02543 family)
MGAFGYCTALTSIEIPASVDIIDAGAFAGCSSLAKISVDEQNAYYTTEDDVLFDKEKTELLLYPAEKQDTDYCVPDSVNTLAYGAFAYSHLESITIPSSVTDIRECVFEYSELKSIVIPDSVVDMGYCAFRGCTNLTSVILSNNLTKIADGTFACCGNLTTITVPKSVTEIEEEVFVSYDEYGNDVNLSLVLKGYSNSYAEKYAKENGFIFEALDEKEESPTVTYTITFTSNGGSTIETQIVATGQKASEPIAPTKKGYTFAGWYNGKTKYNFSSTVTGNVTLTAKWIPTTYKITYKTNGGTLSSKAVKSYTVEKAVSLTNPTKKGYTFAGWYSDSKFKNKVSSIKKGSTGNKTLYAKWTKVSVPKTTLTKVTNAKGKKLTAIWKKVSGAKGYQLSYSIDKNFKKSISKLVTKTSYTATKLTKGKTYYVRVRAYKIDSAGNKVYAKWSNVKKIKITK